MCEWVPGFKEQGSVLHKKCFQKCIKGWTKVCEEKELMMLIRLLQKQLLKGLQPTNHTDCMQVKDFHYCN